MRLVNAGGRAGFLVGGEVFDLENLSGGRIPADPMTVIARHWDGARSVHDAGSFDGGVPVERVRLGPPVPLPRSVFGVGLNYKSHADESERKPPSEPAIFTKFSSCISGPYDDVVLPLGKSMSDWEAELVFVLADGPRHIGRDDAFSFVLGFMCGQDVSERATQFAGGAQFSMGKSFDSFGPTGPALVTLDEVRDPARLHLTCKVNGQVKQDAYTDELIFDVPALVEHISSICTPRAGDICFTGTPAGVGVAQGTFLRPGDVIETRIEGLGAMRNACVPEPEPA